MELKSKAWAVRHFANYRVGIYLIRTSGLRYADRCGREAASSHSLSGLVFARIVAAGQRVAVASRESLEGTTLPESLWTARGTPKDPS
jgi:hypothetical protein